MGIESIGHIYVETRQWEASVAFWEGLGFTLAEQWGSQGHRAGRLTAGTASVTLAEVDHEPEFSVFFTLSDADDFAPGDGVPVATPLEETHWGTRWIRVTDPDGRIHALQEA